MAIKEHPMQALANYLPDGSFELVVGYIHQYKVHLTVTKKRKSVLGDYRHAGIGKNHRISVNGNLNKYEFLITLLHELAHLLTFEQFGHRVAAHGKEWKKIYGDLLLSFMQYSLFPADIQSVLVKSVVNPAATANGETELLLVLRKYNETKRIGYFTIEDLPEHCRFQTENGRIFTKGTKKRKRYECQDITTGNIYLFSPLAEVKLL